jgi:hypothetical protein
MLSAKSLIQRARSLVDGFLVGMRAEVSSVLLRLRRSKTDVRLYVEESEETVPNGSKHGSGH